ncbi:hypothetical protein CR969_00635, partial [Candidatus Saccharibacteria bacterium]
MIKNKKIISLAALTVFIIAGFIYYGSIEGKIQLNANYDSSFSGKQKAKIRATSAIDYRELYQRDVDLDFDGQKIKTKFHSELSDKPYLLEVCYNPKDGNIEGCFEDGKDDLVYTCPYYVSTVKNSRWANIIHSNTVDHNDQVLCGGVNNGDAKTEFSRIELMKQLSNNGVDGQDGILVQQDGKIINKTFEQIVNDLKTNKKIIVYKNYEASEADNGESDQPSNEAGSSVVNNYQTIVQGSDQQTLRLEAFKLFISNGNQVQFSRASSINDGFLSKEDYQAFSQKENVLTVSDGLVRNADNLSLMGCADGQVLKHNSSAWQCADDEGSATNSDNQQLSLIGNTLTLEDGGSVDLSSYLDDTDTDQQQLSLSGNVLSLTNGGSVTIIDNDTQLSEAQVDAYVANNGYLTTEVDGSVTNELQNLSYNTGT